MRPQMDYEKATPAHLYEQFPELERVIGKALHPFQDTRQADLERAKLMAKRGDRPLRLEAANRSGRASCPLARILGHRIISI